MFECNKIYETLVNRQDEKSKYYSSFIVPAFHDMKYFLQNIKYLFPEFPDHGIDHSERILRNISRILDEETINNMSSLEIVVLIFATLFHDSGMCLFNSGKGKDYIRDNHHIIATEVINKYFDNYLKGMNENMRIRSAVIFTCEAHNLSLEELVKHPRFRWTDDIDHFRVRYFVLAFLLRIGDLMDIEAERANCFRMMMYSDLFSDISFDHNKRHQNLIHYDPTPKSITIEVIAENINQYFIWSDWFAYLNQDIEKFNALFAGDVFRLPTAQTTITQSNGADFTVKRLRLDIDENGSLWKVISNSVYTYELDFLREILQNAIDASLKTVYLDQNKKIDHVSPRSWNCGELHIDVVYSSQERTLCVIDYGIGMDDEDLDNFLFKMSGSGKVENQNRSFDFPGIAHYGIGFVSCLINADKIEILTSKNGQDLYKASLGANSNSALVEKLDNKDRYIGTAIVLKLKQDYSDSLIETYLSATFRYVSVPIYYYGLERIIKQLDNREIDKLNNALFKFPYKLTELIDIDHPEMRKIYQSKLELLEKKKSQYDDVIDTYETIYKYFKKDKGYQLNEEFINNLIQTEINKGNADSFLSLFLKYIKENIEYFSTISNHDLREEFNEYEEKMHEALNTCSGITEQYRFPVVFNIESINSIDWNYLFVEINSKLVVVSDTLIKSNQPFSLRRKTGILMIKQIVVDYDRGIECMAINCFLIRKGNVVNKLVMKKRADPNANFIGTSGIDNKFETILRIENNMLSVVYPKYSGSESYEFCSTSENVSKELLEIKQILNREVYPFIQDGIRVSRNMINVFPLGAFRMNCNLTAASRMKLNITRHDISEIRADLDEWMNNVGDFIQHRLLEGIYVAFNELGLSFVDLKAVINERQVIVVGSIDELARSNLIRIIEEKSNNNNLT